MFEEDLAERVDDLFCEIVGGIGIHRDMDTISMLLTGWIIFVFFAIAAVKLLYLRFVKKSSFKTEETISTTTRSAVDSSVTTASGSAGTSTISNGSARGGAKVVETLTGPKVIQSNRPQRPLRRRRISKDSTGFEHSFEVGSGIGDGFGTGSSVCTGPDPVVIEYISKCYDWLASAREGKALEEVNEAFIDAMNRSLRDSDKKNDLAVSVVNVSVDDKMTLNNIFAECIKPNTVKVTADCEVQMKGEVTVSSKDVGLKRCEFIVDRLNGRLSSLFETKNNAAVIKLDGWPEICMAISSTSSPGKVSSPMDPKLTEQIGDKLTATLRNTMVEIELDRLSDFPKPPEEVNPVSGEDNSKKYLLVKVVRGTDLGVLKGCSEPYVVVELDDPPQKFQTSVQEKQSPVWNENFVFNVIPGIGELLFEVHDKVGSRFLGCNILSLAEMGDEKSRILPLKSRRMEVSENFTGAIEVQCTFLDEKEFKSREITEKVSPNGNLIKTTRTVFQRPPDANSGAFTENVIKEFIERSVVPNAEKSTLIIHAVQRDPPVPPSYTPPLPRSIVKIEKMSDGSYTEVDDDSDDHISAVLKKANAEGGGLPGQYGDDQRGRRKTRKGDIFTSLRRRLSKPRSHSVATRSDDSSGKSGEDGDGKESGTAGSSGGDKEDIFKRSVSADRQSLLSQGRLGIGFGLGSARSSVSELSAISGHSTTTYVHENSTLVIECMENRIRKYYLVPPHLAETGKWKKRGKKLHIYNDHTFVAKHIPNGKICEICTTRLPFSLGKQGYVCRDCKMICHKECHVRAPSYCAKTTVYDIELGTTKSLDQNSSISNVFSSFFCGKRDSEVNQTNKDSMSKSTSSSADQIKSNLNNSNGNGRKKKKSNIFRKVTRLGRISEENVNGGEKINGEVTSTTRLDCSDVIEEEETKQTNKQILPHESTVSIPNTNEDEQANGPEEKAIPCSEEQKQQQIDKSSAAAISSSQSDPSISAAKPADAVPSTSSAAKPKPDIIPETEVIETVSEEEKEDKESSQATIEQNEGTAEGNGGDLQKKLEGENDIITTTVAVSA